MKEFSSVRKFQFVQDAPDHLKLRLVIGDGWNPRKRSYLERELRRWVGQEMKIDFEKTDELEKANSGKYRMVISKVSLEDLPVSRQADRISQV
jgi:phenylacetate-CoA ligase